MRYFEFLVDGRKELFSEIGLEVHKARQILLLFFMNKKRKKKKSIHYWDSCSCWLKEFDFMCLDDEIGKSLNREKKCCLGKKAKKQSFKIKVSISILLFPLAHFSIFAFKDQFRWREKHPPKGGKLFFHTNFDIDFEINSNSNLHQVSLLFSYSVRGRKPPHEIQGTNW